MTDHGDPLPDEAREGARLRKLLLTATPDQPARDPLGTVFAVRRRAQRRRLFRTTGVGGTVLAVAAAAALVSAGGSPGSGPGGNPGFSPYGGVPPTYRLTGALVSFNGCSSYLSYVRRQAAKVVGPYGLQPSPTIAYGFGHPIFGGPAFPGDSELYSGAAVPAAGAAGSRATPYSGTTDQVPGVDEPDTVKTNGRIVVTLTGDTLRVLNTAAQVLGTLQLSGDTGGGLVLVGDRAIVLSSPSVPPTFGGGQFWPYDAATQPPPPSSPMARAAVVDLSNPASPRLVRTFEFDGSIEGARSFGGRVSLVLRTDGPRITWQTPSGPGDDKAAAAANRRLVATSTLDEWLPSWQAESPDGSTTPRHRLTPCDAVARPQHAAGLSTVTALTLNPYAATPGSGASVVAAGDVIYETANRLVVAGQLPARGLGGGNVAVPCCVQYPPEAGTTWLYEFALDGSRPPRYLGAGSVPGWLVGSYAIDASAPGYLRVATTTQSRHGVPSSRITVLALSRSALVRVGVVTGLGHDQLLRAVRFLGNTAYVVTYRSYDPLDIVDLRNPARPRVVGRLKQPGYSEFLYPLPGRMLLGVGVEVAGGEPAGLLVATYDVSDPAHPRRISVSALSHGYTPATGTYDPHAFLYWAPKSLAVVALPGNVYGTGATGAAAYRIGRSGRLMRLATFTPRSLSPTRDAVIGNELWVFTPEGVLTANLASLRHTSWHGY